MKIEIWSDVVCPWCYIGKRRFESALARFEHADEVEVVWRSFELDPEAPVRRGPTLEHLAQEHGKQGELKERLMRAYFTESEPVGEREVLARLAGEVGLADAAEVLVSDAYADAVRADEREARLLGISAVPFFVIDRYYGIEGAQPADVILDALTRAVVPGTPQVA